jgi:hypothetical protein
LCCLYALGCVMGLTSSSRIDRERPKKTGGGGNGRRRDLAPLAGGRRGLIFSPAIDLALNRLSRRGISCRIGLTNQIKRARAQTRTRQPPTPLEKLVHRSKAGLHFRHESRSLTHDAGERPQIQPYHLYTLDCGATYSRGHVAKEHLSRKCEQGIPSHQTHDFQPNVLRIMGTQVKHPAKPVTLAIIGCGLRGNVCLVHFPSTHVLIDRFYI